MQYGDKDHITEEQKTMYLAMQEQDTNNTNTVSTAGGQVTDKSTSYLPFKVSQSRTNANANNTTTWGDDDIFEDSKSSNPAGTNSSGNMNPSLEDEANASGYTGMVEVSKKRLVATFFHSNEGEKRPAWTYFFHWQSDERILLQQEVTQITVDQTVAGTLLLTNKCLYFHGKKRMAATAISSSHSNNHNASSGSGASAPYIDRRWYLDQLIEIYGRRYLLQNCAIELFFANTIEIFFAFTSLKELHKFFRLLRSQSTPLLIHNYKSLNPRHAFKYSPWTELWRRRQISNFDYLMRLNILSGR